VSRYVQAKVAQSEVAPEVSPHRVRVIAAALSVIVFNEDAHALQAKIERSITR
jgi:hypothetical protein